MAAPEPSPARDAIARAALDLIEPGMTVGLGSGRAVWAVVAGIGGRDPGAIRAAVASERTAGLARECGIEVVELDGSFELDLVIDGADEVDPSLGLLKGGGGALLREKLVITCARRFVAIAEARKRVERLGREFRLPVEIVPFAWRTTRQRVLGFVEDAILREAGGGPYLTDEGNLILDCRTHPDGNLDELAAELKGTVGVVEHGLFLHEADAVLLGSDGGSVEELTRPS